MPPQAAPQAAASGGAGTLTVFLLLFGLLVIVGIGVKLYDLKRKRDAEAVHLQAQISDALMREPALAGLVLTPTASVPAWGSGPAAVDISGEVSDARTHELVLRIAREEASRIRPDVHIEDRIRETQRLAA